MSGPRADRRCDVVVVGGGIVGCATAYYLARRGVRVVLLERGEVAGEQSGRNWGFVRQQGRDPAEVPLMVEANRDLARPRAGARRRHRVDPGRQPRARADAGAAGAVRRVAADGARDGLDTRLVSAAARSRSSCRAWSEPGSAVSTRRATGTPSPQGDAGVRGAPAVKLGGARSTSDARSRASRREGGRIGEVVTERGAIRAATVVCAAGAWSARLLRPLGLRLPQRWVRATVARTTPAPPLTRAGVWGPAVSFRQRRDGTLNLAAGGRGGPRRHARLAAPRAPLPAELLEEPEAVPLPRGPAAAAEPRRAPAGIRGAPPPARLGPRPRARAESGQGAAEPRRSSAASIPRSATLAGHAELGGLHRRHAGRDSP